MIILEALMCGAAALFRKVFPFLAYPDWKKSKFWLPKENIASFGQIWHCPNFSLFDYLVLSYFSNFSFLIENGLTKIIMTIHVHDSISLAIMQRFAKYLGHVKKKKNSWWSYFYCEEYRHAPLATDAITGSFGLFCATIGYLQIHDVQVQNSNLA